MYLILYTFFICFILIVFLCFYFLKSKKHYDNTQSELIQINKLERTIYNLSKSTAIDQFMQAIELGKIQVIENNKQFVNFDLPNDISDLFSKYSTIVIGYMTFSISLIKKSKLDKTIITIGVDDSIGEYGVKRNENGIWSWDYEMSREYSLDESPTIYHLILKLIAME